MCAPTSTSTDVVHGICPGNSIRTRRMPGVTSLTVTGVTPTRTSSTYTVAPVGREASSSIAGLASAGGRDRLDARTLRLIRRCSGRGGGSARRGFGRAARRPLHIDCGHPTLRHLDHWRFGDNRRRLSSRSGFEEDEVRRPRTREAAAPCADLRESRPRTRRAVQSPAARR